jgi:hypothetical protein
MPNCTQSTPSPLALGNFFMSSFMKVAGVAFM